MNFFILYQKILSFLLLLIISCWLVLTFEGHPTFPIKKIKVVTSFIHIDPKKIQQIISPYTKNGFFAFQSQGLAKELMLLPWLYNVSIQKLWPNVIEITFKEQTAFAEWNGSALLNPDGDIFYPPKDTFPENLPKLSGKNSEAKNILQTFLEMNKLLKPLKYSISELRVDDENTWYLTLNYDLNLLLGQKDVLSRLKLFITIYPKIKHEKKKPTIVDLRYKNGVAIKWDDEQLPKKTKTIIKNFKI